MLSDPPIEVPYLLVTCITCHVGPDGRRYLDALWARDLLAHLAYLHCLTVAAPRVDGPPPAGSVAVSDDPRFATCRYVDLPAPDSFLAALGAAPRTAWRLLLAVRAARIVHSGVNGWPLPPAWFTTPILLFCPRPSLLIVESAFWRLEPGVPASLAKRLRAGVSEVLNRWCVNHADLAIFTQSEYLNSLRTRRKGRAHVIHASWIDRSVLLPEATARALWVGKQATAGGRLRILFAGRLTVGKGVRVMLAALARLAQRGVTVDLDILGAGELEPECAEVGARLRGPARVRLLGQVAYGPDFFRLLQDYHLLLVPSLSDEQPRIVYDAYSQALPVLASDTPGLRDCVRHDVTGRLFRAGDAEALLTAIVTLAEDPAALPALALAGLAVAAGLTHQEMHERRHRLLGEAFPGLFPH